MNALKGIFWLWQAKMFAPGPGLTAVLFSPAHFDAKEAGNLSTLFDVGGIIGETFSCSASGCCIPLCFYGVQKRTGPTGLTWGGGIRGKRASGFILNPAPARLSGPKKVALVCRSSHWCKERAGKQEALWDLGTQAQAGAGQGDGAKLGMHSKWEGCVPTRGGICKWGVCSRWHPGRAHL